MCQCCEGKRVIMKTKENSDRPPCVPSARTEMNAPRTQQVVYLDSEKAAARSLMMSPQGRWREMGGKERYLGTVVNLNKCTQGVLISKLKHHGIVDAYISKKLEKKKAKQSSQEIRNPKEVKQRKYDTNIRQKLMNLRGLIKLQADSLKNTNKRDNLMKLRALKYFRNEKKWDIAIDTEEIKKLMRIYKLNEQLI